MQERRTCTDVHTLSFLFHFFFFLLLLLLCQLYNLNSEDHQCAELSSVCKVDICMQNRDGNSIAKTRERRKSKHNTHVLIKIYI